MRVLRTDMIVTLREDFITVARAKGMPTWRILLRDALKPSSLTLITILGLQIGHWISAAVIIEIIYAMPGIGRLLINAIYSRDVLLVQGCSCLSLFRTWSSTPWSIIYILCSIPVYAKRCEMADAIDVAIPGSATSQSKCLGLGFWLPVTWITFVLLMALCANIFELPEYGHIDWRHPAAPPGTVGTVTLVDRNGESMTSDYIYWLGTD